MRIEIHNLDGNGPRPCRVYEMQPVGPHDFWTAVTDVPCPVCDGGTIRWAEAGYVAGYRICDQCQRHFIAKGDAAAPVLVRVHKRKG